MPRDRAGDTDYEAHGHGYATARRADPRIAALVHAALGDSRSVINVGAGAGSYEPTDRYVVAVEPSATMRAQRPPGLVPALDATAEALPFDDDSFDTAMAMSTVHQWPDLERGLHELRRVSRGPVVVLTFDGETTGRFWLADYVPELIAVDRSRFPAPSRIAAILGGTVDIASVPIPRDCTDGIIEAFYARPERFLDLDVRRAQSGWSLISQDVADRAVEALRRDLDDGTWDQRYGHLREQPWFDGALRLVTGHPGR